MKKYVAPNPEARILGAAMTAFEQSSERETFLDVLKKYNLDKIDPEVWYPEQLALDIQKEIKSGPGAMQALVSIGMVVTTTALFPPIHSLEDAVMAFAIGYPMNFRNIDRTEDISAKTVEEGKIKVVNHSPLSDDLVYGFVYGLINRFKPAGSSPTVEFEDYDQCDSDGNTVFYVTF